ncbi:hypothetical protein [Serratia microhaemolytica]|uniref:hypothetical protein n=1 Tax=Serratia microhaemolytica TaxID=2675110 RepID=UPI000FDD9330|nr:hypothetical protein [Serratia microhaemolytica]
MNKIKLLILTTSVSALLSSASFCTAAPIATTVTITTNLFVPSCQIAVAGGDNKTLALPDRNINTLDGSQPIGPTSTSLSVALTNCSWTTNGAVSGPQVTVQPATNSAVVTSGSSANNKLIKSTLTGTGYSKGFAIGIFKENSSSTVANLISFTSNTATIPFGTTSTVAQNITKNFNVGVFCESSTCNGVAAGSLAVNLTFTFSYN